MSDYPQDLIELAPYLEIATELQSGSNDAKALSYWSRWYWAKKAGEIYAKCGQKPEVYNYLSTQIGLVQQLKSAVPILTQPDGKKMVQKFIADDRKEIQSLESAGNYKEAVKRWNRHIRYLDVAVFSQPEVPQFEVLLKKAKIRMIQIAKSLENNEPVPSMTQSSSFAPSPLPNNGSGPLNAPSSFVTAPSFTPSSMPSSFSPSGPSSFDPSGPSFSPSAPSFSPSAPSFSPSGPSSFDPSGPSFNPSAPSSFSPSAPSFSPSGPSSFDPSGPSSFNPSAPSSFNPATPSSFNPSAPPSFDPSPMPPSIPKPSDASSFNPSPMPSLNPFSMPQSSSNSSESFNSPPPFSFPSDPFKSPSTSTDKPSPFAPSNPAKDMPSMPETPSVTPLSHDSTPSSGIATPGFNPANPFPPYFSKSQGGMSGLPQQPSFQDIPQPTQRQPSADAGSSFPGDLGRTTINSSFTQSLDNVKTGWENNTEQMLTVYDQVAKSLKTSSPKVAKALFEAMIEACQRDQRFQRFIPQFQGEISQLKV